MKAAVIPPEQELALLLCQTASRRERYRGVILDLAGRVDYDELAVALNSNRLLATCGDRLREVCGAETPASFVEMLESVETQQRARSLLFESMTIELARALEAGGVATLPLKGALLARRIYPDAPSKPSVDIDLLVARRDLPSARRVVESHGYVEAHGGAPTDRLPDRHHVYISTGQLPPVELHWRIHEYETDFSERMLARSSLDSSRTRRAAADDEFAALLLFYQRDTFTGMRLAADVAAWWDVYGAELAPGSLAPIAAEHPQLCDALLAAAAMAQRVVGVPALPLFGSAQIRRRRTYLAMRMADWTLRDSNPRTQNPDPELIADMALIEALMTPEGSYRSYVRRRLLQDAAPDDERAADAPSMLHRLRHICRAAVRSAKGVAFLAARLGEIRRGGLLHPLPASVAEPRARRDYNPT